MKVLSMSKLACVLVILTLLYMIPPSIHAAGEPVGEVALLSGVVRLEREGISWQAQVGDEIKQGDRVETEGDSEVELLFLDESRIKMAADTSLEINEYSFQPASKKRRGLLSMLSGKARILVHDFAEYRENRFLIQTETAVVGIRGTSFIVWIVSPLVTKAFCLTNKIEMLQRDLPGKPVTLAPYMVSEVSGKNPPSAPRVPTIGEISAFFQGVEEMAGRPEPYTPPTLAPPPPPPEVTQDVSDTYDPTASDS